MRDAFIRGTAYRIDPRASRSCREAPDVTPGSNVTARTRSAFRRVRPTPPIVPHRDASDVVIRRCRPEPEHVPVGVGDLHLACPGVFLGRLQDRRAPGRVFGEE